MTAFDTMTKDNSYRLVFYSQILKPSMMLLLQQNRLIVMIVALEIQERCFELHFFHIQCLPITDSKSPDSLQIESRLCRLFLSHN